ncbi:MULTISPECIES: transcriptional regulator RcsA [Enterobacteriaceae]|uniref:transcriptional regulator RcsA n=1 Tax=Enterobacteriaceae TaxID=543 RepID=UPI0015DD0748|nr:MULTISPECIES: transcriptional regulator RcsA [unclassified Klebsiella]HAT3951974.1 transcriptional regulator RcsA [Kluyvera ascorbata]BBR59450.1 transcriptional regulatory protein RcsA [Klebsiella sp. WP4-W18-ESBL-05]BBS91212.1 transcriptional regulatory protein RcsA [Klebsiella sp. WP7-S18-CRE-02]BBS96234.1 transcriptional regulatory protein RcsA [Klebsiella sp. WP7-S18-CRE-03]BBT01266.1 transcriptional regulatory protein RcsA [Klebsiella sp. WP7-S18-ESBL-04]
MSTIIMDLCSYTRLGLTGYLASRGVKKRDIDNVESVEGLTEVCASRQPSVVFINEDCFIHDVQSSLHIKQIINQHPKTLFIVFMAIANIHFDEYLMVRSNLLISSKSIKPETLDSILGNYLKKEKTDVKQTNMSTLSLSRTESSMLKMWMSGQGTIQISDQMNIKAKTVSSHKGNIKKKIKTHNKQVIYHVVRLAENVTSGIFVNMR